MPTAARQDFALAEDLSTAGGALDFVMKWNFQKVASIIHEANTSQRVANDGVNQPLTVVVVHNMWRVGEIETHYNHLSDEYVTRPTWQSQVPRFAGCSKNSLRKKVDKKSLM